MTARSLSLENEYKKGYEDAIADMQRKRKEKRQRKQEKKERSRYFLKQKLDGALLLLLTVFAVKLLDGDATIAILTVPLGIYLIFTNEMCIVNNFY